MSWDSYIDNLIAQTKDASGSAHADKACIIGIDGGALWTTAGHAHGLKVSSLLEIVRRQKAFGELYRNTVMKPPTAHSALGAGFVWQGCLQCFAPLAWKQTCVCVCVSCGVFVRTWP